MLEKNNKGKLIISAIITLLSAVVFGIGSVRASALVHNSRFDDCEVLDGIDVSVWQGDIDFNKVKNAGIDYVIIRLGYSDTAYGEHYTDTKYAINLKNAKAAGLKVGVYYFSTAVTTAEAKSEAQYCLSVLGNTKLDLPVYFDQECSDGRVNLSSISQSYMTKIAEAFCDTVKAGGYQPGFYSYISWLNYTVDRTELETRYPIWMANVTNQTFYDGVYHMWQYSFTGKVSGISTAVDRNVMYVTPSPAKVSKISASTSGTTSTISWSKVTGAAGYKLYKVDSKNGDKLIADLAADVTSYKVAATTTNTKYYVRSYNLAFGVYEQQSKASSKVSVVINAPYSLSSKSSLSAIKLSWKPLSGVTGYVVYEIDSKNKMTQVAAVTETSAMIKGLGANEKHNYCVAAYTNSDKTTEFKSGTSKLSPLSETFHTGTYNTKVTDITLTARTSKSLTLSWKAPNKNYNAFRIYTYDQQTKTYKGMATVKGTTAEITGLESNKEYTFMIRSQYSTADATILSEYSDFAVFTTEYATPEEITATAHGTNSIALSWKGDSLATEYRVYLYDPETKTYKGAAKTKAQNTKITGLKPGTEYTFMLRAGYIDADGKAFLSKYSEHFTTGTAAGAVSALKVSANSKNYQTLTWTKPDGQNVDGYRVYSYDPSTKKYKGLGIVTENSLKVTGLKQATNTYYMVRSYYKVGETTILSAYSEILHAFTCYPSVGDVKTSGLTSSSVKLSFSKIKGADGYAIYQIDTNGKYKQLLDTTSNTPTVKGLDKKTSYRIVVRAYKKINSVRYLGYNSNEVNITTKS